MERIRAPAGTRWPLSCLVAVAASGLLGGCGSVADPRTPESGSPYYPPPAAFRQATLDLGERMPAALRTPEVPLAFATTRRPAGSSFGDEMDGALHLGTLSMRIGPADATWDDLLDWARLNEQQIPGVRVALGGLERTGFSGVGMGPGSPDARFLERLEPAYAHGGRRVLLFIHGYNTTFAEAAALLACMHHHQGRQGAAVLFSWPAGTEVMRYLAERDLARDSTNSVARLITLLAGPGRVERIDCLVNSTGAQILMGALHQLEDSVGRAGMPAFRLNNVVLASPDVGLQEFVDDDLELLAASTRRTVVYGNRGDRALGLAGWWHGGSRLGRVEGLTAPLSAGLRMHQDQVELVDVTNLPGPKDADGFTHHGAWYANPLVVTDALLALLRGEPAAARGLRREADQLTWQVPEDYQQRAAATVGRVIRGEP